MFWKRDITCPIAHELHAAFRIDALACKICFQGTVQRNAQLRAGWRVGEVRLALLRSGDIAIYDLIVFDIIQHIMIAKRYKCYMIEYM